MAVSLTGPRLWAWIYAWDVYQPSPNGEYDFAGRYQLVASSQYGYLEAATDYSVALPWGAAGDAGHEALDLLHFPEGALVGDRYILQMKAAPDASMVGKWWSVVSSSRTHMLFADKFTVFAKRIPTPQGGI